MSAVEASLTRAVRGGYVLRADRAGILEQAGVVAAGVDDWN